MSTLPIGQIRSELTQALRAHGRVVLQAPTGSGKSTQVPQFLLDDGLSDLAGAKNGRIVVLQPRRIAARLLAKRVAEERGVNLGQEVGYQYRLENVSSQQTRILYVTEGILLRQMQENEALPGVSVIIFDEFHERHLEGDVALARARQIQRSVRPDLKLVVMSATLETQILTSYLEPCAVVQSPGRTFPVTVEYLPKPTETPVWDLAAEAVEKLVTRGTCREGNILIFMPGAYEIQRTLGALQQSGSGRGFILCPLHGELPASEQDLAVSPSEKQRIIVATNVAETSLTIDGVRTVIDGGLARVPRFDPHRGINTLLVEKISRASAQQRLGRAGRSGSWHALVDSNGSRPAAGPDQTGGAKIGTEWCHPQSESQRGAARGRVPLGGSARAKSAGACGATAARFGGPYHG
jgi:ATP-dependent helicase HrpB